MKTGAASAVSVATILFLALTGQGRAELAVRDFSGQRAFSHVKQIADFGPRPPGSAAIRQTQKYIDGMLRSLGMQVRHEDFTAQTPLGPVEMKNIVGVIKGRSEDFLLVGGHYDSKLFADFQFVGANDGGSSTGLLLELARAWAGTTPPLTLHIAFFDGEEALVRWSENDSLYGSKHMARNLSSSGELSRIRAAIVVDMIGDSDLNLIRDSYSNSLIVERIWAVARDLGYERYFPQTATIPIEDDHLPFARLDVPTALLIDFTYGGRITPGTFWHTAEDTLDKISPDSLLAVGQVVSAAIEGLMKDLSPEP